MAVTMTTKFYKGNVNWVTDTNYFVDEIVTHNGSGSVLSYQCTVDHTSTPTYEPGVGASWTDNWDTGVAPALDLSKIVFTSPNMDSPNTAGTRSHILPGLEDLGLWYEDTTNLYRVEDEQLESTETFFGYTGMLHDSFDLSSPALSMTVSGTNQVDWVEFVRERVSGNDTMDYTQVAVGPIVASGIAVSQITSVTISGAAGSDSWYDIYDGSAEEYLDDNSIVTFHFVFDNPVAIAEFYFDGINTAETYKTYRIDLKSKANIGDSYTSILTNYDVYETPQNYYFEADAAIKWPYRSHRYYALTLYKDPGAYTGVYGNDLLFTKYETGSDPYNTFTTSSGTPTQAEQAFSEKGWTVAELGTTDHWVEVEFPTSKRITKAVMTSVSTYEAKYFKIQAKYNSGDSYVDLYTGQLAYNTDIQEFTFSNLNPYKYYRLYFMDKWAPAVGMGIRYCRFYEFGIDETVTTPIPVYFSDDQIVNVSTANPGIVDDYQLKLEIDTVVDGSSVLPEGTTLYCWGYPNGVADVNMVNSINIEVTNGECYNCRLTAWDDVTHTTTTNELIAGDYCRVSSLAFNCKGDPAFPTENEEVSFVHPPSVNNIFKGNVVYGGIPYYYGDFNLKYRTAGDVSGDYLIFKPMLYNVNPSISYGVHDFYIVLHYSYT